MISVTNDPLPVAVDRLAWSLTAPAGADDPSGLDKLARALAAVEQALAGHSDALEGPEGALGEAGRGVLPLWPLERRVAALRREHGSLAEQAADLRRQALSALPGDGHGATAATGDGPQPDAAAVGRIFRQADRLLQVLQRHQNEEADLRDGDLGLWPRLTDAEGTPGGRRAVAFLDAVCPRCDQRGMDLVPAPDGVTLAVCLHCGSTHPA